MTHRPGQGDQENAIIKVHGNTIWSSPVPMPAVFTNYSAIFKADGHGKAMVRLQNDSPNGDKTVFIDDITITPSTCDTPGALTNADFSRDAVTGFTYRTPKG